MFLNTKQIRLISKKSISTGLLDIGGTLQRGLRERDGSVLVCPCMREWTVSSHSSASTSYSCLSLPLSLHLSFFLSFSLRLSHLFICRCLTVLIIALALAQHVLPKQDTEMEFEKEGVCGRL